jgi:hypothetical protein
VERSEEEAELLGVARAACLVAPPTPDLILLASAAAATRSGPATASSSYEGRSSSFATASLDYCQHQQHCSDLGSWLGLCAALRGGLWESAPKVAVGELLTLTSTEVGGWAPDEAPHLEQQSKRAKAFLAKGSTKTFSFDAWTAALACEANITACMPPDDAEEEDCDRDQEEARLLI